MCGNIPAQQCEELRFFLGAQLALTCFPEQMFQAALALAGGQASYSVEKLLFKVIGIDQPFLFRQSPQQAALFGAVPTCDQLH